MEVTRDSQDLVRTGLWLRAGRRLLQPADDASPRQRVLRVGKFYGEFGFQRSWGTPDAVPGRVFKGKVRLVLDAIAAGQMQATGALVDFGARTEGGRALAVIDIEDDMSPYQIPLGAAAQVAIYTEHWHHVSLIRKILLRMRSWQNYIFLEGH